MAKRGEDATRACRGSSRKAGTGTGHREQGGDSRGREGALPWAPAVALQIQIAGSPPGLLATTSSSSSRSHPLEQPSEPSKVRCVQDERPPGREESLCLCKGMRSQGQEEAANTRGGKKRQKICPDPFLSFSLGEGEGCSMGKEGSDSPHEGGRRERTRDEEERLWDDLRRLFWEALGFAGLGVAAEGLHHEGLDPVTETLGSSTAAQVGDDKGKGVAP